MIFFTLLSTLEYDVGALNLAKTDESKSRWQRFLDNDIVYSFFTTPGAIIAASVTFIAITAAFAAPLIAPYNPFDPAQIS